MPIYAYRCGAGHQFEVKQSILEAPLVDCLTCGQPVRRVVFPVGIVFKGQGFYTTDSRSSSASSITTSASEASAEKTTKPEAKPKDGHSSSESSKAATAPAVATPSSSASSAGEKNG